MNATIAEHMSGWAWNTLSIGFILFWMVGNIKANPSGNLWIQCARSLERVATFQSVNSNPVSRVTGKMAGSFGLEREVYLRCSLDRECRCRIASLIRPSLFVTVRRDGKSHLNLPTGEVSANFIVLKLKRWSVSDNKIWRKTCCPAARGWD